MSGCVTETEDPIVGTWSYYTPDVNEVDTGSSSMVFNAEGTGFSLLQFDVDAAAYAQVDFTWKNEGDGKYTLERPEFWYDIEDLPQHDETLTLDGDKLTLAMGEFTMEHFRQTVSEYIVGLWATDVHDYDEFEDIVSLVYISEDGTGNIIVYGSDVMGIDDVGTTEFTWEEKDGVVYCVEESGEKFTLTLKNGVLYEGKEEVLHKYSVEDRLLGIWMSDKPSKEVEGTFDIVIVIRPGGTGVEIWTVPGSHVASAKYYFTWEMTGLTSYQAVYDDGEVWDFETVELGLTDGGVNYSKVGYDVLAEYAQKVTA